MRIFIKVKTNSTKEKVEKLEEDLYKISVKALPEKGKANSDVIKLLADYFGISKNQVKIKAGHTSKSKIVEIVK